MADVDDVVSRHRPATASRSSPRATASGSPCRSSSPSAPPRSRSAEPERRYDGPVTRVKICGITRLEDAELAAELGAWALGFILWPGSKRAVEEAVAAGIAAPRAPPGRARRRVRQPDARRGRARRRRDRAHATCSCTATRARRSAPRWRAARARRSSRPPRIAGAADLQALERFRTDFHLLDTAAEGMRGGTGQHVGLGAWPPQRRSKIPAILAGGLTPENVAGGDRRGAPVRGRRRLRRGGRARASRTRPSSRRSSPPRGAATRGSRATPVTRRAASSTASAPTAASTCPRR